MSKIGEITAAGDADVANSAVAVKRSFVICAVRAI